MKPSRFFEKLCSRTVFSSWQNQWIRTDVDDSAYVSSVDALLVINYLNSSRERVLGSRVSDSKQPYYDVNDDGTVSPIDALLVINALNDRGQTNKLVAGISNESDPNGNGVVLCHNVLIVGQTVPNARVMVSIPTVTSLESNSVFADADGKFEAFVALPDGILSVELTSVNDSGVLANASVEVKVGDVIQDWNAASLNVIRAWSTTSNDPYEGRIVKSQPPMVARNLAMIHLAMFEASNAKDGLYQSYLSGLTLQHEIDPTVAAAAAGYTVASKLYSDSDEVPIWDASLEEAINSISNAALLQDSIVFGKQVGERVLELRKMDGARVSVSYSSSNLIGRWNRTYPDYLPALLPQWPNVTPFTLQSANQFRPPAPPTVDSKSYADAVDQVMQFGGFTSSMRSADQREIALFWADGGGTFTPPGHWNQIASDAASKRGDSMVSNARTFALLNLALADAGIAAWDAKYAYDIWRPIDAIRKANLDGNPRTTVDGAWLPLLATPPFPSYVSGHSTFSAAAATVLTSIFGDLPFDSKMDAHDGYNQKPLPEDQRIVRHFDSFWQAAEEAGKSRIYGGIHFSFDNEAGLLVGRSVGEWIVDQWLTMRR